MLLFARFAPFTAAILSLLTGCVSHDVALSPRPATAGSAQFSLEGGDADLPEDWWQTFRSKELSAVMETALGQNLTLQQAAARIRQAEANRRKAAAAPLPAIDIEGQASDREPARNGGAREILGQLSLAWEMDLWGRLGSATQAAEFEARAVAEDYRALRLLVSADVARTYYDAVEQQLLINLLEDQLEINQTLLELTELRFDQVGASAVDVLQQKRQLEATREQMAVAQAELRTAENRLDVLLGQSPDGIDRVQRHEFPKQIPLPKAGIPANLLVTRPDLRRLRDQLVARDYEVAVAIAERLPRVGIGVAVGYSEGAVSGDLIRSAVLNAVQPMIDWGERKAEVDSRRAAFDEQLLRFTETYLVAIEEVENALYRERRQLERIASLKEQRDLAEQQLAEARNRYTNGLTDYLPVLDAVQSLQRAQRDLLSQRRELLDIRILLYRALGGPLPKS